MIEFQTVPEPDKAMFTSLSVLAPTNPFYTAEYADFRRIAGYQPWAFLLKENGRISTGCTAFLKNGVLSRSLEIASVPSFQASEAFWAGLMEFCRRHRISDLCVNSFSSEQTRIPMFAPETWRKQRREFVIRLQHPDLWKAMTKGHSYCIKRGRKAGLQTRWQTSESACIEHARLVGASMVRRQQRGEKVSAISEQRFYLDIVHSGAGALYQAMLDDRAISSSVILRAPKGAYLHSLGSDGEGMKIGAAHFLLYELGNELKAQSVDVLNLGGTEETEGGLVQFKTGFGASTVTFSLEAAHFVLDNRWARYLRSAVGRIRSRFH
ncbi:MAG: GNAT family N-acetyltransferase [Acidobacteriota bacterium]|jgi:hypothetical protein